mgnify:CR=1 FL=1
MSKWYEKTLEEKSNIIYSRIRLARNWDEYVFPSRLDEEGSRELVDGLKDGLKEIPYPNYALENMQQAEKKALRERRILNRCAVEKTYAQGLYLSEDESESILLGADDHIRMQFLAPGLCLEKLWQKADAADDRINEHFPYAYDEKYEQAAKIKVYLGDYMNQLNNNQFQKNSDNYLLLQRFLRYMEAIGTVMFFLVVICDTIMVIMLTRRLTNPLKVLAGRAKQVTNGDLSVQIPIFQTGDEVESLSKAFDKMMESIRSYIEAQRISMEKETELRENELKTQTLLKDAQLKYLQSQINPHFLFNTLNAGMQLATIEDAEKTAVFIENMAEFFRYNLSKINEDATLYDEIQLVDRYIYILNVRFAGDIHYQKEVEEGIGDVIVPSMILQPLVENAVQYGIRDVEWEGVITLLVYRKDGFVYMEVKDNGKGMAQSLITRILDGENVRNQKNRKSNGIGIYNVRERLMMYYNREDVLFIESEGENKGTKFTVKIPCEEG